MPINKLESQQKQLYWSIRRVYSPALGGFVVFNSSGWVHLRYKRNRMPRKIEEKRIRLELLHHVPGIIENAAKISEVREQRRGHRLVRYIAIEGCAERSGIKVIITQVGKGRYFFTSVMAK